MSNKGRLPASGLGAKRNIRKNDNGSRIDLQTGTGYARSFISMQEGYDINIATPNNASSQSVIALSSSIN
jgi:hypothetical protein